MNKIKLDLQDLHVETFATVADGMAGRGTVRGLETHVSPCEPTEYTRCWGYCGGGGSGLGCEPSAPYTDCCTNPYERACYTIQEYGCQTGENSCGCPTVYNDWTCIQAQCTA